LAAPAPHLPLGDADDLGRLVINQPYLAIARKITS
jgi:hypothetical protein